MNANGCVLVPWWRKQPSYWLLILIILVMIMMYPLALNWLGFPATLITSAMATVSLLASRLFRAVAVRRRARSTDAVTELPADIW